MFKKTSLLLLAGMMASIMLQAENAEVAQGPTTNAPTTDAYSQPAAGKIQWYTNYQEAAQVAKKDKKPLFLFFTGSDWCGWCKKMESEILSTPDFANAAGSRFVFVMLDFPMNQTLPPDIAEQNNQLKQKYGVTGYPTVIILDSNENFVAETGYRSGGGKAYADYIFGLVR